MRLELNFYLDDESQSGKAHMVWGFIAKSCLDGTAVNSLLCLRALEVFLCNLNL